MGASSRRRLPRRACRPSCRRTAAGCSSRGAREGEPGCAPHDGPGEGRSPSPRTPRIWGRGIKSGLKTRGNLRVGVHHLEDPLRHPGNVVDQCVAGRRREMGGVGGEGIGHVLEEVRGAGPREDPLERRGLQRLVRPPNPRSPPDQPPQAPVPITVDDGCVPVKPAEVKSVKPAPRAVTRAAHSLRPGPWSGRRGP